MSATTVTHASFELERSYDASPARVFQAFADPAIKRQWFAVSEEPDSLEYSLDFRVGGRETRSGKGGPTGDWIITNETVYHDIVPDKRIIVSYRMLVNGAPISVSLATFELIPDGMKTRLVFTEQDAFLERADGIEMRRQGWSTLLDGLGRALERQPSRAGR